MIDGAYNSSKNYAPLRKMGIKLIIKPRRNAKTDREGLKQKELSHKVNKTKITVWAYSRLPLTFSHIIRVYLPYFLPALMRASIFSRGVSNIEPLVG